MGCCHCLSSACNASWGRVWVPMSSINATELFALLCSLWATPTAALGMGVAHTRSSDKHFSRDLPLSSSLAVLHWAGRGSHTHTHSSCKLSVLWLLSVTLRVSDHDLALSLLYHNYLCLWSTDPAVTSTVGCIQLYSLWLSLMWLDCMKPGRMTVLKCAMLYFTPQSVLIIPLHVYVTIYQLKDHLCWCLWSMHCARECPSYACMQTHHIVFTHSCILWSCGVCVWTHSSVTMIP